MTAFNGAKLILFLGERIVVLHRDNFPDIPWPDRLDFPGGARDGLESAEDCVVRETEEEVGLRLARSDLIWRHTHGTGVFFAAHMSGTKMSEIVFGSEGQGWRLMRPEDYVTHPMAIPHFAMVLQTYLDHAFG